LSYTPAAAFRKPFRSQKATTCLLAALQNRQRHGAFDSNLGLITIECLPLSLSSAPIGEIPLPEDYVVRLEKWTSDVASCWQITARPDLATPLRFFVENSLRFDNGRPLAIPSPIASA